MRIPEQMLVALVVGEACELPFVAVATADLRSLIEAAIADKRISALDAAEPTTDEVIPPGGAAE